MAEAAIRISFLSAVVTLVTALYTGAGAIAAEPFTIQLHWLPQAQFMGIYVAKDKGFYADEGLDATTPNGGPGVVPIDGARTGVA
jgi:NitT/TauT family transport system substrate-binding protein